MKEDLYRALVSDRKECRACEKELCNPSNWPAPRLRRTLLEIARTGDAKSAERDVYGRRYTIDFIMMTAAGRATVRSGWILIRGKKAPRLTTCYVKKKKR